TGAITVDDVAEVHVLDGRVTMVADAVRQPDAGAVYGQVAEVEVDALLDQPPGLIGVGAAEVPTGPDHRAVLTGDGQVAVDQNLLRLDEFISAQQQRAAGGRVRHGE